MADKNGREPFPRWVIGAVVVPLIAAGIAYLGARAVTSSPRPTPTTTVAVSTTQNSVPDPPSTTLLTAKQSYIRDADDLCYQAFQEVGNVVGTVTDRFDRFEQVILIHQGLLIQWGRLEPPAADASAVDRILQTYDRANARAVDAATAGRRGDGPGYYAAEAEGKRLDKQAAALARSYGFRVCHRLGES